MQYCYHLYFYPLSRLTTQLVVNSKTWEDGETEDRIGSKVCHSESRYQIARWLNAARGIHPAGCRAFGLGSTSSVCSNRGSEEEAITKTMGPGLVMIIMKLVESDPGCQVSWD